MKTSLPLLVFAIIATMVSCTKDNNDSAGISDVTLSSMATTTDGFVLMRTTKAGANEEWKIKMNDLAAKAVAEGRKYFPVNSMLVKEKYNSSGKLISYASMFRTSGDKNSDGGWLFNEVSADGHLIYSSSERGMQCQSCHSTELKY